MWQAEKLDQMTTDENGLKGAQERQQGLGGHLARAIEATARVQSPALLISGVCRDDDFDRYDLSRPT